MKFLVDHCAGRRLADWLRQQGLDVREAKQIRADLGDAALLQIAAAEKRILITIDTDFGALIFLGSAAHAGLIRLPDVPAAKRIALLQQVFATRSEDELTSAIITLSENRIRFSQPRT